jgi:uncharacterized repeat protein (TIGR03803 family)
MPAKARSFVAFKISALLTVSILFTSPGFAQTVYNFQGTPDGSLPDGRLLKDAAGNLYGTTGSGGAFGFGSIYELMAGGGEKLLYSFTGGADGWAPSGGMLRDGSGYLMGTAAGGGDFGGNCGDVNGCGTAWVLSPAGKLRVLYTFTGGADGANPAGGLVRGSNGVFYGTTEQGGSTTGPCVAQSETQFGCGVAFRLDRDGTYTVLHTFTGGSDGQMPVAPLTLDASGNLYGTTFYGGGSTSSACTTDQPSGCGVIFKIDASGNYSLLHTFKGTPDAAWPEESDVTLDAAGNLYGTTAGGGASQWGAVYKIDSAGTESVLYSFTGGSDGAIPRSGLIRDGKGNLYGTASFGPISATDQCTAATCGVVFKLTPSGTETVLHRFPGRSLPVGDLLLDQGYLYGTTLGGGSANAGVVFKVKQ